MPQPVVSPLAQRMYNYLKPWQISQGVTDEQMGWPLLRWCTGYAGLIQDTYDVVKTRNGKPGWTALTDPDQATALTMPFLAQLIGTRLIQGEDPEQWRDEIKDAAGLYAGAPHAIAGAIQKSGSLKAAGPKTVLILERDTGSAYHHMIGVFENDLNNYTLDGGFESGLDGWAKSPDGMDGLVDDFVTITRKKSNVHSGLWALEVAQTAVTSGIAKTIVGSFKKGQTITVKLWTYYTANHLLKMNFGGVTPNRFSESVPVLDFAGGFGRTNVIRSFTLTEDVVNPTISLAADVSMPFTWNLDDFSFQVDGGERDLYIKSALRQKPIGHIFDVQVIEVGDEWTYFTIGATRWQRDETGFMVEIPTPYQTFEDIENYFRNLEFFDAARLEWLNYNHDFSFGDNTNWTPSGSLTTATAQALSEGWQRSPGYAMRILCTNGTGAVAQDQGPLGNIELIPGHSYKIGIVKKIITQLNGGRIHFTLNAYDSGDNLVDAYTVGTGAPASVPGTYTQERVITIRDDLDIQYVLPEITVIAAAAGSQVDGYVDEVSIKFEPEA